MDKVTLDKVQHQFWVKKQAVYRKLGKKEDECIVASDAELDAKLELFKSIQQTSLTMNKVLDRFQERICFLAQEQNAMGRFLKEYGKSDKTATGKMMIQMGKTLIYSSQQEIALRPPLLRLYQEVETFRCRAVEDTLDTISQMERHRTEYRASLNWMKNISQELNPDTNKQMDKFRKVQSHVKQSKGHFDKLKLACLQKVDLLAAARCNMFSHALIQYQNSLKKITGKDAKVYNILAVTFKGYQPYEFSFIKDLAEPSKQLSEAEKSSTQTANPTEELLFDFQSEDSQSQINSKNEDKNSKTNSSAPPIDLLSQSIDETSQLLDNLLSLEDPGGSNLEEPETGQDALLSLGLGDDTAAEKKSKSTTSKIGSLLGTSNGSSSGGMKSNLDIFKDDKNKESSTDVMDLLTSDEFDTQSFENNTMSLLNELLGNNSDQSFSQAEVPSSMLSDKPLTPVTSEQNKNKSVNNLISSLTTGFTNDSNLGTTSGSNGAGALTGDQNLLGATANNVSSEIPKTSGQKGTASFMPSQLFDFSNFGASDLINLSAPSIGSLSSPRTVSKRDEKTEGSQWYDIFADLDPIANPDAVGKKEGEDKEIENRYC